MILDRISSSSKIIVKLVWKEMVEITIKLIHGMYT